jgi:hypothetical protein
MAAFRAPLTSRVSLQVCRKRLSSTDHGLPFGAVLLLTAPGTWTGLIVLALAVRYVQDRARSASLQNLACLPILKVY